MNGYKEINKFINSEGKCLKINKVLIKKLGIEAAVLYSELLQKQIESINNEKVEFLLNKSYFVSTIENIQQELGISAHKQRVLLNHLQNYNLLDVYYKTGNIRMISVNNDLFYLYKLMKPSENLSSLLFENFSKEIKNFISFIKKNYELFQQENICSDYNEYEYLFENELKKSSSTLEKRMLEVLKDKNFEKEIKENQLVS